MTGFAQRLIIATALAAAVSASAGGQTIGPHRIGEGAGGYRGNPTHLGETGAGSATTAGQHVLTGPNIGDAAHSAPPVAGNGASAGAASGAAGGAQDTTAEDAAAAERAARAAIGAVIDGLPAVRKRTEAR